MLRANAGDCIELTLQNNLPANLVDVPGWNTRTTRDLLKGLDEVPIVHFGDLDPNGIAILAHLRRWRPDVFRRTGSAPSGTESQP